jgi:hypothetical protein
MKRARVQAAVFECGGTGTLGKTSINELRSEPISMACQFSTRLAGGFC